ncbi:MAG TPA: DUF3073 domain-containing protein [Polyangia bacterium]|nr:DUF3073 domain-containing protein [Polyangia bacterium]
MGRGRAKAKQTKVARELKYSTGGTDLEALRKELASAPPSNAPSPSGWVDDETDAEFDDEDDDDDDLNGKYGASGSR